MNKLKLMTIVGTRPEIIRLSEVIKRCDSYFDHLLVHTGQNYDYHLNEIFFKELGLRQPDHYLEVAGGTLGATMGAILERSYDVMLREQPEALLVLGDTNSALCAICAKRLKIPVFHMEAGNRCFDQNVPEEINRKIVDHISDVNLPYTEHSRRYLLQEGIRREYIFVTGSPIAEVLHAHADDIAQSNALSRMNVHHGKYILVSAHREENLDIEDNFDALVSTLNTLAETYGIPLIYSTHPRTKKRLEQSGVNLDPLIQNVQPFGFFDYNCLQKNAFVVLSDSGTLSEESAMLGFPAVLFRTSTERPEVLDKGSIVVGGITPREVLRAVEMATSAPVCPPPVAPDYTDINVSEKVARIILSYTPIINKNIWQKHI